MGLILTLVMSFAAASVREGAGVRGSRIVSLRDRDEPLQSVGPSSGGGNSAFGGRVAEPALEFLELHRGKADEVVCF